MTSAAAFRKGLALLGVLGCTALAAHEAPAPAAGGAGLALRLADGSLVRLSGANEAGQPVACARSTAQQSASLNAGPRRAPLKRRAPVFDAGTPGVVASVRG